jgi:hypothetical protein
MLAQGTAFLVPSGPAEHLHLHVVASAPRPSPDFRLLIPISSKKHGRFHDPACEIAAGEHPFIVKDSFVLYKEIQKRSASKILLCIQNGEFVLKDPIGDALLSRILAGLHLSDFTSPWVFEYT